MLVNRSTGGLSPRPATDGVPIPPNRGTNAFFFFGVIGTKSTSVCSIARDLGSLGDARGWGGVAGRESTEETVEEE